MNLDRYEFSWDNDWLDFEFYSDGPKGKIKKVVRFSEVTTEKRTVFYNLGFGDWNEEEQRIDDFIVTDNKDAEKVLRTVASLVLQFTEHYPGAIIFAKGSSSARTRRYQMGLNKYWKEIEPLFSLFGLVEDREFVRFKKGINYEAFVIQRKKVNLS
jgi:hypothetical protein